MSTLKYGKNLTNYYNNMSIKRKIFIFCILLSFIPLITFAIYANTVSNQAIIEKATKSSGRELELIGKNMNTLISDMEDYSRILSTDYRLQQQLKLLRDSIESPVSKIDINSVLSEAVSNIVSPNTRVAAANVLNAEGEFFDVGVVNKESLNHVIDKDFISFVNAKKTPVWTSLFKLKYNSGVEENIFAIAKAVIHKDTGDTLGTVCIYIKEKTVESIYIDKTINTNNKFYIVDSNGAIISSNNKNDLFKSFINKIGSSDIMLLKNRSLITTLNNSKVLVSVYDFEKLNWKIVNIVPLDEITVENQKINKLIITLGIIFLVLSFFASYGLSKTISSPILKLVLIMKGINQGNMQLRANFNHKDEIGVLGDGFNNMMDKIDKLIYEINYEQKMKREFEFKLLQSQINPHFLYNSIETIISLISLEMKDEAVATAQNLASFYRISLSKGKDIITIGEELKLIDSYLLIQKYRYIDYMDYCLEFQEEILRFKIPKLTLQPIVENSIYHGLKSKPDKGYISIKGSIINEKIVIEVFDNGAGMSDEQKEYALKHFSDSGQGHSFGLGNVNARIQLIYGHEFGIKIDSEINRYTRVILELPLVE